MPTPRAVERWDCCDDMRERSYAAPDEVAAFCREDAAQLSPLMRREALRVMVKRAAARNAESG